jgi:hypothetical protein
MPTDLSVVLDYATTTASSRTRPKVAKVSKVLPVKGLNQLLMRLIQPQHAFLPNPRQSIPFAPFFYKYFNCIYNTNINPFFLFSKWFFHFFKKNFIR